VIVSVHFLLAKAKFYKLIINTIEKTERQLGILNKKEPTLAFEGSALLL